LPKLEVDFRISPQDADDASRAYRRTVTAARAGVLKQGFRESPWRTLERNARADATPQEITATDHREILAPTAGQTSHQYHRSAKENAACQRSSASKRQ
jgi:hypothetical protein